MNKHCVRCDPSDEAESLSTLAPLDFGQQYYSAPDAFPWVLPLLAGLAMAAWMLMLILGKGPWQ